MRSKALTRYGLPGLLLMAALLGFAAGQRKAVNTQQTPAAAQGAPEPGAGESSAAGKEGEVELPAASRELAGIKTEPVRYDSLATLLQATGQVEANANRVVKVGPFVSGRIARLSANIGDTVAAGQTLAVVDSTEVAQARAAYEQAQAEAANAQRRLTNTRKLAQSGVFTQKSVEETRERRNEVASQLANMRVENESELRNAEAAVKTAQAVLDRAENTRSLSERELQRRKALVAAGAVQYKPLEDARRESAEAQRAEQQARTALGLARSNLARTKKLFEGGIRSRRELEETQAAYDAAEADVTRALEQARIAGQVQAREQKIFDSGIYASRETQQAETELMQAEKAKTEAEAALHQAQQRLAIAQSPQKKQALAETENRLAALDALLRRETGVAGSDLYGQREVQAAEADVAQANVRLLAARNGLEILRATASGGTASVPIVAPISGRILERAANRGQMVKPEDTLFTILDLSSVWVDARVYEKDVHQVKVGQPVTIVATSFPNEKFLGKVSYVGDTVDEKTRALLVRCEIANPQRRLKPEMFVKASITTAARGRVLVVPDKAVQSEDGKSVVYAAAGKDKFRKQEVTLGGTGGGYHEVLSGLTEGQQVVTEGSFLVKSQAKKDEFGGED